MKPILLAGPTAAGKSELALALAEAFGGCVINADSQQVYAAWRILSARPDAAAEARAPHRLYGHLPLHARHSAGDWLRALAPILKEAASIGQRPIITGGTGLYFRALTEGLSEIPEIPAEIRTILTARFENEGLAAVSADLAERDPRTAAEIDRANPARVLRALEVLQATGRGLADWQASTPPPVLPTGDAICLVIEAQAAWLDARIADRFAGMMAGGAVEEVRAARASGADPTLPGMKAIGVAEISGFLDGTATRDETLAAGTLATRRYAKRQRTWFRNQMPGWVRLPAEDRPLDRALATVRAADQA
ncbi:MAG: tRNA (adenosine(37)-N6)-dimethylallyltransferase MiaA [Pseudomonadota bacterium]